MNRAWLVLVFALTVGCQKEPPNTAPAETQPRLPPAHAAPEPGADPDQTTRARPADALIAFTRGRELWTCRADGTDPRKVLALDADIARPAWSPNRKWIAFDSAVGADRNLYARNIFIVRPDGTGLRQVTPMPRSGESLEHAPKGLVRGRAVAARPSGRVGMKDFAVSVYGRGAIAKTVAGGLFEVHAPVGTTWIKVSGEADGVRYSGMTFEEVGPGELVEARDIVMTPHGADDVAFAPSWAPDGRRLTFLVEQRAGGARSCTLQAIGLDGRGGATVYADNSSPLEATAHGTDYLLAGTRDGRILRLDARTRQVVETWRASPIGAPIAVGPDGASAFVTLDELLRRRLVVRTAAERVVATVEDAVESIDFSPDGRFLVIEAKDELRLVEIETGAVRTLIAPAAQPAWYGR